MKRSLLVLLISSIVIFSFVTVSHSQYTTTQITNNSYADAYPQINNNGEVVWMGLNGSDDEIRKGCHHTTP